MEVTSYLLIASLVDLRGYFEYPGSYSALQWLRLFSVGLHLKNDLPPLTHLASCFFLPW
jgi:hypothetical protein